MGNVFHCIYINLISGLIGLFSVLQNLHLNGKEFPKYKIFESLLTTDDNTLELLQKVKQQFIPEIAMLA